ncbi:MAG: hypothetical protein HYY40_12070 [Bacteroidetes bacterium]|nr:hypothetical protein [Bacteroidota bacterium]
MNRKLILLQLSWLLFNFICIYTTLVAQPPALEKWNDKKYDSANSANDAEYLTQGEKQVIFYTNLARMNGPLFAETYLQKYLDSAGMEENSWVQSLRKDLRKLSPLSPMKPEKELFNEAYKHARGMGEAGRTGHSSPSGESFGRRMKKLQGEYDMVAENCQYGNDDPLSIVIDLLIDEGVSGNGHRMNMLDPNMQYIGVSIQPHKKYGYNCVMDFGGREEVVKKTLAQKFLFWVKSIFTGE